MAQQIRAFAAKPGNLSAILRTDKVERPDACSCPLTYTHACTHTHTIKNIKTEVNRNRKAQFEIIQRTKP